MRRVPAGLGWLAASLLGVVGCYSTEPNLKPAPHPEEYVLPPSDDARFSSYISYPKELLNTDSIKKDTSTPGAIGPGRGPTRFGAGGGPY
jgi:hypothetical protein